MSDAMRSGDSAPRSPVGHKNIDWHTNEVTMTSFEQLNRITDEAISEINAVGHTARPTNGGTDEDLQQNIKRRSAIKTQYELHVYEVNRKLNCTEHVRKIIAEAIFRVVKALHDANNEDSSRFHGTVLQRA